MSTDQNKAAMRRFYDEVVNQGKLDVLDELLADNVVEHEAFPGLGNDKAAVRAFFAMFRAAFPDIRMEEHDMIAEGDRVAARVTITGTHRGEFMGVAPTGKAISIQAIDIVRFNDRAQAIEHWGVTDQMTMMQQLGAIPAE